MGFYSDKKQNIAKKGFLLNTALINLPLDLNANTLLQNKEYSADGNQFKLSELKIS